MSELSPRARAFLSAHSEEGRPDAAERGRVRAAVLASIALPPVAPPPSAPIAGTSGVFTAKVIAAALATGALLGGMIWRGTMNVPPPVTPVRVEVPAPAPAPIPEPVVPVVAVVIPEAVEPTTAPVKPTRVTPRTSPAVTPSTAAPVVDPTAEFRLLRRAQAATRDGRATEALALLDQHTAEFGPRATLTEEALVARVRAHCALQQPEAARSAAAALERHNPASVHLKSVQQVCW